MFQIVLAIHLVLCVFLVSVVLLQQGKGAEAGVTFTGGSNTVFGVSGAGNVLTKATTGAAVLFMLTSLLLVKYYPVGGVSTGGSVTDPLKGSVMERVSPPVEKAVEGVPAVEGKPAESAASAPAQGSDIKQVETKSEEVKPAENAVNKAPAENGVATTPKEAAPK